MLSTRLRLLILALLIGVGVVVAESGLYSLLTQQQWRLSNDLDLSNVMLVPYAVLALMGIRRVLPWAVALTLTLSVWGWWLYLTARYYLHPDGSGANIGAALLLFGSPFLISVAAAAVHFILRDAPPPS